MRKGMFLTMALLAGLAANLSGCSSPTVKTADEDPYLWLEEVEGEKPLNWVREQNAVSARKLENDKRFKPLQQSFEQILNADDRIPYVSQGQGWVYNFWQDKKNVRGIYRRTALAEYQKPNPRWNVLLDLDLLSKRENENWVWAGADCLPDDSRCLITLSWGGKDAAVTREFDPTRKQMVTGGFVIPESKHEVAWKDKNTLLVAGDFGPESLTESGYPRTIRIWKRDQPFAQAEVIFEGEKSDVSVSPFSIERPEGDLVFVARSKTFFESQYYWLSPENKLILLPVPLDINLRTFFKNQSLWSLRSEATWEGQTYPSGSLVSIPWDTLKRGQITHVQSVFTPTMTTTLGHVVAAKNHMYLQYSDNVVSQGVRLEFKDDHWEKTSVLLPGLGVVGFHGSSAFTDTLFATYESYTTPTSLYMIEGNKPPLQIKTSPARFNAESVKVEQRFATSRDGTRVPYFLVGPQTPQSLPTLLYGYGGFEVSQDPNYMGGAGKAWLEKGYVWVEANIRGGGEFGPRWHQAALKENRQKAFDDFIAVAEDLIKTGVTTPEKLAIQGGSNGGLLVGSVFVQRPDLFRAVICQVPLLDMMRFHKLLAGASWMAEYGSPEIFSEREALLKYSPYQNVRKDVKYPDVFFITSTKDDRVHPGHARKMVARMMEQGHSVLYFENTEGGHSAAANLKQRARMSALEYTFLYQELTK